MAGERKTLDTEMDELLGKVLKMKLRAHQEGQQEAKGKLHTIEQILMEPSPK